MPLILTTTQAEAIYSAMCELNNIGAEIGGTINAKGFSLRVVSITGEIRVSGTKLTEREFYADQSAFAAAYGLQQG